MGDTFENHILWEAVMELNDVFIELHEFNKDSVGGLVKSNELRIYVISKGRQMDGLRQGSIRSTLIVDCIRERIREQCLN
ncbi:hypothetical protein WAK64_06285 [Bacillus spongiae]|uniref:Uncharacterized protein n=1 Tax=Bacillus spongiae TaxID=2683610 RepID=A0ABU8HC03_9BACI